MYTQNDNVISKQSISKQSIFKRRFINELPLLINCYNTLSIDFSEDEIVLKKQYNNNNTNNNTNINNNTNNNTNNNNINNNTNNNNTNNNTNININISLTSTYPWKPPTVRLNNILYSEYIKSRLSIASPICLHCKSLTNKLIWSPSIKLSRFIGEIEKMIDYKQACIIMIMVKKIKEKYLVGDIPIEKYLINLIEIDKYFMINDK